MGPRGGRDRRGGAGAKRAGPSSTPASRPMTPFSPPAEEPARSEAPVEEANKSEKAAE